jgi:hypothetical protein
MSAVRVNARDRDPSATPNVDVGGHIRDLARVAPVALALALIVAFSVFMVRSHAEKEYDATATVSIAETAQGAQFNELTEPLIALLADPRVLDSVVNAGLAPSTASLSPRVSATTGRSPTLLMVTAKANSADAAKKLVVAVVQSLDDLAAKLRAENIRDVVAELQRERNIAENELTKLSPDDPLRAQVSVDARDYAREVQFRQAAAGPSRLRILGMPTAELVAPKPVQEATFAGLVALLLSAELLVQLQRSMGRRANRVWARRQARRRGLDFGEPSKKDSSNLHAILAAAPLSGGSSKDESDDAVWLVFAGSLRMNGDEAVAGRRVEMIEATPTLGESSESWQKMDEAIVLIDTTSKRADVLSVLNSLAASRVPTSIVFTARGKTAKAAGAPRSPQPNPDAADVSPGTDIDGPVAGGTSRYEHHP